MISLITGLPGSGKTSLMVHMLMTRDDLKNRPLYVDGIPELKIPTQPIPDGEDMTTWHKWAPTGAILVIDEAQRIFRPRPAGSKVPDYVQELETHRHKGIDFFILTQHPRLIDVNLRSLIGEHRNISNTMLGIKRISYWQKCANPESRADVAEAKNSIFFIKKDAFGMYKSAEEHNKVKGKLSAIIWIFPIVVGILAYLGYFQNQRWKQKMGETTEQVQTAEQSNPKNEASNPTGIYKDEAPPPSATQPFSASDYIPTVENQPWSAPLYDGLNRNIQTMPYPVACIKSANSCNCYTDQATKIKGISAEQCIDWADNGIYNPYIQSEYANNGNPANNTQRTGNGSPNESPAVLELGGKPLPSLDHTGEGSVAVIQ